MAGSLTGYGAPAHQLRFDGDESKYELWETKMLAYMKLKKLKTVILPAENNLAAAVSDDKKEEAYSELILLLDERSQNLIMQDAKDDGRKALEILRQHYAGHGKQRIISLYITLTSLKKYSDQNLTDYILKAETAATSLRAAGQIIPDELLVAMVLKGLPARYKPFQIFINQQEKVVKWLDFKIALRNFEENDRESQHSTHQENVMKLKNFHLSNGGGRQQRNNSGGQRGNTRTNDHKPPNKGNSGGGKCFKCDQPGHKFQNCPNNNPNNTPKKWCSTCKSGSHFEKFCRRRKDAANKVALEESGEERHTFSSPLQWSIESKC